MKINTSKYLLLTIFFFGLVYSLISIINHCNFRTYALDLGLYTNALYKYGHLILADSLMIKEDHEYLLGSHFDLYLIIFSPLVYIFHTYTLLIVQITGVLAGGIGVYKYFRLTSSKHTILALNATIYFFSFYGIYSAISYDYHSTVIAAMLIPWLFYFLKKEKYLLTSLVAVLVLISQENVALWLLFICLGLIYEYRKNKTAVIFLSAVASISLIYFLTVIYVIIPAFSDSNEYTGFTYSVLGITPLEAFRNLILHPLDNIKILFINHNNSIAGDYVKMEMLITVLISGAFILLLRPHFIFMLIPVFLQKLFNDNYLVWGIDGQYSIEFAPVLAIGIFSAISEFKNKRARQIITALVLLGVLFSTIRVMDNTILYTNKSKIRFYQANHYIRKYNVKQVHEQLDKIQDDAIISAQSPFVPHLALRDHIYQFPIVKDAEYIVYSEKEGKYPLDEESFNIIINQIIASNEWETQYRSDGIVILKRKR